MRRVARSSPRRQRVWLDVRSSPKVAGSAGTDRMRQKEDSAVRVIVEIEQGMLLQGEAPLIYLMSDRVRRSRTLDALFFLSIFLRPDLDD